MHPSEFNDIYLKDLLENLSHENKATVMMGDFNIDILKYDTEKDSADFLDSMYTSYLLPYISTPSRVTPCSETLIDNIFSNNIEDGSISGNIVTTICDHYAQFLLLQNVNKKIQQTVKYIIKTTKNSIKITLKEIWSTQTGMQFLR